MRRVGRGAGLIIALGIAVVALSACTRDLEPRRTVGIAEANAVVDGFDSPRETMQLARAVDIGALAIKGRVETRDGINVIAPGDGRVIDVQLSTGDVVEAGQTVATFVPTLSRAEELQRQILELEVELAAERGSSEDERAELQAAVDDFDTARVDLATPLIAPRSGVIRGVSANLTYRVDAGEAAFTVLTGTDLVTVLRTTAATVIDFSPGDEVRLVPFSTTGSNTTAAIASIQPIEVDVGQPAVVEIRIDARDEASAAVMTEALDQPSSAIDVEFDIEPGTRTWLPRNVLHRQDGRSFLLVERDDGSLQRVTPQLGRRTSSHIEVLDATAGTSRTLLGDLLGPGTVLVLP